MLTQESRDRLNSIIGRMKDNGESEDSIREMVAQFKAKYDTPEPPPTAAAAPGASSPPSPTTGGLQPSPAPSFELPKPKGETMLREMGRKLNERGRQVDEALQRSADTYVSDITGKNIIAPEDRQTLTEGLVQGFGSAAAGVGEAAMVPLSRLAKGLYGKLPKSVRKPIGAAASSAVQAVAPAVAPVAKAVSEAVPQRVQRDIGGIVNVAGAVPVMGSGAKLAAPTMRAVESGLAKTTEATGRGLKQLAGKTLQRNIVPRPSVVRRERLDPKALLEYKVAGNMKQSLDKIDNLFDATENKIQASLKAAQEGAPDVRINKESVIAKFKSELVNKEHPDLATREDAALEYADKLSKALDDYIKPGEYGDMTLEQANRAKRFIGKKAFKKGATPTVDTQTQEYVWDQVYFNLMKELETKVPGIREYNQVFAKLKPWQKEIEYRTTGPDANKSPISLLELGAAGAAGIGGSIAGGSAGHAVLPAIGAAIAGGTVMHATHSPTVAKALYGMGKGIEALPKLANAEIGKPIAGGGRKFLETAAAINKRLGNKGQAGANVAEGDAYHDAAAAAGVRGTGANYKGSLNTRKMLGAEQHYVNDDAGTGSSFVVNEGEDAAKALDAHRRRFWGEKYGEMMKRLKSESGAVGTGGEGEWYLSGRNPQSSNIVMFSTKSPQVANFYAGEAGKVFAWKPTKETNILDATNQKELDKIKSALLNDYENGKLPASIDDLIKEGHVDELVSGFNPKNIVEGGETLDEPGLWEWLAVDRGIDVVETHDGALLLNPKSVEIRPDIRDSASPSSLLPIATGGAGAAGAGVNPQVHTPEFKAWFGDWQKAPEKASKVVDESGRPLVVYRGSTRKKVNVIDPEGGIETPGAAFFTDNPDVAETFRYPREYGEVITERFDDAADDYVNIEPGALTEAHLNIRKPLILTGKDAQRFTDDTAYQGRVVKQAKADGYDGIIAQDVNEGVGDWTNQGTTYAIFNKYQAKSATGNSGKFSPTNPDIRGSGAVPMLGISSGVGLGALTGTELFRRKRERDAQRKARR